MGADCSHGTWRLFMRFRDRRARILQKWLDRRRSLEDYPLAADKRFIEPYILTRRTHGHEIDFLVVNEQGQRWYDKPGVLSEFELFDQLGMVRPGAVVFDCGAHQGYYALVFSKMVGGRGRVFAFEPFPVLTDVIELNRELNSARTLRLFKVGLGARPGTVAGSLNEENLSAGAARDLVAVTVDTLDQYARLRPDLVKLDVEGAEVDALEGARELLKQCPHLYVEVHPQYLPRFGRCAMEIFDFLSADRYTFLIAYPRQPIMYYDLEFPIERPCALYCVRKDTESFRRTTLGDPSAHTALADLARWRKAQALEVAPQLIPDKLS